MFGKNTPKKLIVKDILNFAIKIILNTTKRLYYITLILLKNNFRNKTDVLNNGERWNAKI